MRVPAFVWSPRGSSGSSSSRIPTASRGSVYAGLMHHVDWLTTFVQLARGSGSSGSDSDTPLDVDGVEQWSAIVGAASTPPRVELVLDLPHNTSCAGKPCGDPGVAALSGLNASSSAGDGGEGVDAARLMHGVVAVRAGDLKLLMTVGNDTWYDPHLMAASCPFASFSTLCDIFVSHLGGSCSWSSFLFNISADPAERVNLYYEPEYVTHVARLHSRVSELMLAAPMEDFAVDDSSQHDAAAAAFERSGGYVVPWGCPA